MDVVSALAAIGGAARTGTLLDLGCSRQELRRALDSGRVRRVARGLVATADAAPDVVLAARLGARLTCVSALAHFGLPLRAQPTCPHLAVPNSFTRRGRDLGGARLHYQRKPLAPGQAVSVADALDAAGGCIDDVWHLVAVDAALHKGLVTTGDIMAFTRSPKERRDFLLRFSDARSEAPGETIARLRLVQAGFAVRPQAYLDGAGDVDLEVEGLLMLQVDGYEFHSDRQTFKRDRQKGRAVVKAGRPLLSYAGSELVGNAIPDVVGEVRAALALWALRGKA